MFFVAFVVISIHLLFFRKSSDQTIAKIVPDNIGLVLSRR